MKSRQQGITLLGFLIILAIVGFFGYMGMKLVPAYAEYMGVAKSMEQIATDEAASKSLQDMRQALMFKMNFQYVDDATIRPSDITLLRNSAGANVLRVVYDKKIPFLYNIDFLLHFQKDVVLAGNVSP